MESETLSAKKLKHQGPEEVGRCTVQVLLVEMSVGTACSSQNLDQPDWQTLQMFIMEEIPCGILRISVN